MFMILTNAMSSDLLDTIADLELKKRDLSILKSEISANFEYAQGHQETSESIAHLSDIENLVQKQEALLDTFSVLEEKLDLIELKAKFLDLKDIRLESQKFVNRTMKLQKTIDNISHSKNLKKYLDFFIQEKFEQAAIIKSVLNFKDLSICKTFERDSELVKKDRIVQEKRLLTIKQISLEVDKEIELIQGIFKSLYRLHSLSQALRHSYALNVK
jgi:hypothetical protein